MAGENEEPVSITDGKLRVWLEDDATMSHPDHETPKRAYERISGTKYYPAQVVAKEDHGDWCAVLLRNGWVVAYSPMGGEVYMPEPKEVADLKARLVALEAELATEREMREAADASAAVIPMLCRGDFSVPCALHVRAPIEALHKKCVALETENRRLREALEKADDMVPWFRQGTIWVGGRADHAERVIAGLDQLSPTKYTQECVDTFRGWVNETHRRIGEYESARRALKGDQNVTGT